MISLATTVKRGLINTTGDERQMNRSGCTGKNTRYWPVLLDHYSILKRRIKSGSHRH